MFNLIARMQLNDQRGAEPMKIDEKRGIDPTKTDNGAVAGAEGVNKCVDDGRERRV